MEILTINQSQPMKEYQVDNYDSLCEEHFKITKIIPLKKTSSRIFLNIIIHIFTVGLIQFIYGMYPKVEKFIRFTACSIEESDILGIYCQDGKFYFESVRKIKKIKIDNKDIEASQLANTNVCILFTFKLFTYLYNPETKSFHSLKFEIQKKNSYILIFYFYIVFL